MSMPIWRSRKFCYFASVLVLLALLLVTGAVKLTADATVALLIGMLGIMAGTHTATDVVATWARRLDRPPGGKK